MQHIVMFFTGDFCDLEIGDGPFSRCTIVEQILENWAMINSSLTQARKERFNIDAGHLGA